MIWVYGFIRGCEEEVTNFFEKNYCTRNYFSFLFFAFRKKKRKKEKKREKKRKKKRKKEDARE